MIKGIGHAAYRVENMEASLKFYCDILGFKKAFTLHNDEGQPVINYIKVRDGQFIELFFGGTDRHTMTKGQIGYNHLCLEVENIQQIADHLTASGVTLDVAPKQGRDTNYQCWAKDPDGNRIEFMQMNPESPQMKS